MGPAFLGIAFGLASALGWGAGDFFGGLASKRNPVHGVVILSQLIGFVLLVSLAVLLQGARKKAISMALGVLKHRTAGVKKGGQRRNERVEPAGTSIQVANQVLAVLDSFQNRLVVLFW